VSADLQNGPKELENITEEQKTTLLKFAPLFTPADIVRMLEYLQIAQVASKTSVIPELPLEIALVKIITSNKNKNDIAQDGNKSSTNEKSVNETKQNPTDNQIPKQSPIAIKKDKQPITSKTTSAIVPKTDKNSEQKSNITSIDLDTVQEKWAAILDKAKQLNASLSLALSTARPLEIRDSAIVIAVKYAFHKERLDEQANQLTLKDAFDSILKCPIKLRVVLEARLPKTSDVNETKETGATTEASVLNPLVSQALDLLGGQLVQESN
jgi:DNA polymerase III gamma/tau subunit